MGFRISTSGVILALLAAFMQAPFSHVHEHESTQHHRSGFFHTHLAHAHAHHSAQPELRDLDPNDDAVFQHWFSPTQTAPQVLNFILIAVPALLPPVSNEWRAEAIHPSAHDPPGLIALPPRSPPA
ncbi:MAG: hypothetical protein ACR2JB_06060 [Bryobacteraceae bacterium]